jgi:hypothetical protein
MARKKSIEYGYNMRFRYDVAMNNNGVPAICIDWCEKNCQGNWGWWFDPHEDYDLMYHNVEAQDAYMSFQYKRDAVRFWFENVKAMAEAQRR